MIIQKQITSRKGAVFATVFLLGVAAVVGRGRNPRVDSKNGIDGANNLNSGLPGPGRPVTCKHESTKLSTPADACKADESPLQTTALQAASEPSRAQSLRRNAGADSSLPQGIAPVAAAGHFLFQSGQNQAGMGANADKTVALSTRTASRQLVVFVFGFVVAGAAAWVAWINFESSTSTPAKRPIELLVLSKPATACFMPAVASSRGSGDGRFPIQNNVSGLMAADIASFALLGREFATTGQPRDAEGAFLMACRVAENLNGADSVASADAKFQLGVHYAKLGVGGNALNASGNEPEVRKRADIFLTESLRVYSATYGDANPKTRLAADHLAQLKAVATPGRPVDQRVTSSPSDLAQELTVGTALTPVPPSNAGSSQRLSPALTELHARRAAPEGFVIAAPSTLASERSGPAAIAAPAPAVAVTASTAPLALPGSFTSLIKSDASVIPVSPAASALSRSKTRLAASEPTKVARLQPSFNCEKGRSMLEKMICSDAELANMDRELGRLYARARKLTPDRVAFKRQQENEWISREATCRDRACLLRWYAQRRIQLTSVIERHGQPQYVPNRVRTLPGEVDGIYKGR